jgi:hypothetical protein
VLPQAFFVTAGKGFAFSENWEDSCSAKGLSIALVWLRFRAIYPGRRRVV